MDSKTFAKPLTVAFFKLPMEVAIPLLFSRARFASSPVPVPAAIRESSKSRKAILPPLIASYKSIELASVPSISFATKFSDVPIVSLILRHDCISTVPFCNICAYCSAPRAASAELDPLAKKALFNPSAILVERLKLPLIPTNFCVLDTISSSVVGSPSIALESFLIACCDSSAPKPNASITFGKRWNVSKREIAPSIAFFSALNAMPATLTATNATANDFVDFVAFSLDFFNASTSAAVSLIFLPSTSFAAFLTSSMPLALDFENFSSCLISPITVFIFLPSISMSILIFPSAMFILHLRPVDTSLVTCAFVLCIRLIRP